MHSFFMFFIITCFLFGFSNDSFSSVFRYSLNSVPHSEGGCLQTAVKLKDLFQKITGIEETWASCENATSFGYDIVISYSAPQSVDIVSTEYVYLITDPKGGYQTQAECLDNFEFEVDLFRNETGLEPFFAYCYYLEC